MHIRMHPGELYSQTQDLLRIEQTRDLPLTLINSTNIGSRKTAKPLSRFTTSMELVWHGEFTRLFSHLLPHSWLLSPTFSLPKGRRWNMYKDSAKVRFLCQNCFHGWTSMKGRVVFWFFFDNSQAAGIVLFRLFGQRCKSCNAERFEHAMWYPEEVLKVVGNVFNRIGQEYYGFYSPAVRVDRRAGKPKAQHNSELCQACVEGICPGEFDESVETASKVMRKISL